MKKIDAGLARTGERSRIIKRPSVTIAANLKREREMIDIDGNIIDPRTKQVIQYNQDT